MAVESEDFVDKYFRFKRSLGAAIAFLVIGITCLSLGLSEAAYLSKPLTQFSVLLKFALVSVSAISIATFFHAITSYYKNGTPIKHEAYLNYEEKQSNPIVVTLILAALIFLPLFLPKIFNFDLFSEKVFEASVSMNVILMTLSAAGHVYSYWKPMISADNKI